MSPFPPDLDAYVNQKVVRGAFRSREEFAAKAVRIYRDLEQRHELLQADLQAAVDEADQGESQALDLNAIKHELLTDLDENGQPR